MLAIFSCRSEFLIKFFRQQLIETATTTARKKNTNKKVEHHKNFRADNIMHFVKDFVAAAGNN